MKNNDARKTANIVGETTNALILSVNNPIESQILDSGSSFHSTSCREIMKNHIGGDFEKVHLADDEPLKIIGKAKEIFK